MTRARRAPISIDVVLLDHQVGSPAGSALESRKRDVGGRVGQHGLDPRVAGDAGAGGLGQLGGSVQMVEVPVGEEDVRQGQAQRLQQRRQALGLGSGVDGACGAALVADQVAVGLQGPNGNATDVHRRHATSRSGVVRRAIVAEGFRALGAGNGRTEAAEGADKTSLGALGRPRRGARDSSIAARPLSPLRCDVTRDECQTFSPVVGSRRTHILGAGLEMGTSLERGE